MPDVCPLCGESWMIRLGDGSTLSLDACNDFWHVFGPRLKYITIVQREAAERA